MKQLVFVFLFFIPLLAGAQLNKEVWLINGPKYLGEGFKQYKVDFVFDGRNSFEGGDSFPIGGFRIGIEVDRVNRIGLGFYNFSNALSFPTYTSTQDSTFSPVNANFNYRTLYFERVLYFDRKWEWSVTGHAGGGEIKIAARNPDTGDWEGVEELKVNPVELSSSGYHHLSWWLSAGLGVGYRWMFNTPAEIRPTYQSVVYLAKVKIRIGKAIRAIGNKDVKNEY